MRHCSSRERPSGDQPLTVPVHSVSASLRSPLAQAQIPLGTALPAGSGSNQASALSPISPWDVCFFGGCEGLGSWATCDHCYHWPVSLLRE